MNETIVLQDPDWERFLNGIERELGRKFMRENQLDQLKLNKHDND